MGAAVQAPEQVRREVAFFMEPVHPLFGVGVGQPDLSGLDPQRVERVGQVLKLVPPGQAQEGAGVVCSGTASAPPASL